MTYHYQFPIQTTGLNSDDFTLFSSLFSRCLNRKIFEYSECVFAVNRNDIKNCFNEPADQQKYKKYLERAFSQSNLIVKCDQILMIPFSNEDQCIVAVMKNVDRYFLENADEDWLLEMKNSVYKEFLLIKNANTDILTRLPNVQHLEEMLNSCDVKDDLHLMLVELFPSVRTAGESMQHIRKATLALKNFFNDKVTIHSVGQGVFAIATKNIQKETHSRMGEALISWMRRENFRKVHIGVSSVLASHIDENRSRKDLILDMAWYALQVSSKRGPFSYCDYDLLTKPEAHPLRKPTKSIINKMQSKWRYTNTFTIVQFQLSDEEDYDVFADYCLSQTTKIFVQNENCIYAFLSDADSKEALTFVDNLLNEFEKNIGRIVKISAGVSSFPFVNFSKTETILNCRKALLHADFFGPGSRVVFDPVSLNISGDIFYGDGDFLNAIKEYKRGLLIDPTNVNLLNSLGVAYAVIEKPREARKCFLKALKKDRKNFMALYNLGLGEELQGENLSALKRFEKALPLFPEDESEHLLSDLHFQIGKLYCRTGKYQKGIDVLIPWYRENSEQTHSGRAFSHLGSAYFELKKYKKATEWLQKALTFDTFDAQSMGLLGASYLQAGEGVEIALRLCQKSVELEPLNKKLRLYLAQVQAACGLDEEAKNNLKKCVRHKDLRLQASFLLGSIYEKEGKRQSARIWFGKILEENKIPGDVKKHIMKFNEEC